MHEHLLQDTSAAHTEDTSGLEELKQAMDEIHKLSNESDPELSSSIEEKSQEEQLENAEEIQDEEKDASGIEKNGEDEEEEEQAKTETPKQKEKKFWKERREKYKALAERDRLASELEELRDQHKKALEVGNYHYGQNAYLDLEKAKMLHKKAIEEGDTDAYTEANIALVKAANAVDELERWSTQNNAQHNSQQYRQDNQGKLSLVQQTMAQDWLELHPELNPQSANYNALLAKKVGNFINALDSDIADSGQNEHYFSENYFDAIDKYIDSTKKPIAKNNTIPASADNVAGVKKSYQSNSSSQSKNTQKIILTADEKRMAANAGISEADWLKYKMDDLNKQKRRV